MGQKSPLFYRRQSGGMFSVVDESKITGNIWFVDSGATTTGSNAAGYGQNPDKPFRTLDYAIGAATANNGDHIFLMPGHAETLTTAGAVAIDQAGLTIIGLGEGAARPTFTFTSTDNTASILITAASTKIKNILGICGDDALTNPFHVQAADCELDITWRDPTDVEAATCILTTASADRIKINLKYEGYTGGNACVSPIQLIGVNEGDITVDFYGKASTAVIDMNTTLSSGIRIRGYFYNSGTTDMTKNVTANVGSCLWFVEGYDGAAGQKFSGGSGAAVAGDDVSSVASQCTSIATGAVSLGTQVTAVASQAASVATGMVSVGTQTTAHISQATSIATGTVSVGTQTTAVASQATSIATGAVSIGTQATAVASQATSIATGAVSVGAQVLSSATSIGTATSILESTCAAILSVVNSKP